MKIKICGITRLEDARFCAGAGADYLGFIQHPESLRYVAPAAAREIIDWIYGPEAVGVFVDVPAARVNDIAESVGFTMVQLHGSESPELCSEIDRPIIKAIRVYPESTVEELSREMDRFTGRVAFFLLDTGKTGAPGGTGVAFDWDKAAVLADVYPLFLAGGLTPDNVAEAVEKVRPRGIDASSGLESAPGVKDFEKLVQFFDAVRSVGA